jgi:hypothetical protein
LYTITIIFIFVWKLLKSCVFYIDPIIVYIIIYKELCFLSITKPVCKHERQRERKHNIHEKIELNPIQGLTFALPSPLRVGWSREGTPSVGQLASLVYNA